MKVPRKVFNVGDVVKITGGVNLQCKRDEQHIVEKTQFCSERGIIYATDQGAWFCAKDFKLIRKADSKSFAVLLAEENG